MACACIGTRGPQRYQHGESKMPDWETRGLVLWQGPEQAVSPARPSVLACANRQSTERSILKNHALHFGGDPADPISGE